MLTGAARRTTRHSTARIARPCDALQTDAENKRFFLQCYRRTLSGRAAGAGRVVPVEGVPARLDRCDFFPPQPILFASHKPICAELRRRWRRHACLRRHAGGV